MTVYGLLILAAWFQLVISFSGEYGAAHSRPTADSSLQEAASAVNDGHLADLVPTFRRANLLPTDMNDNPKQPEQDLEQCSRQEFLAATVSGVVMAVATPAHAYKPSKDLSLGMKSLPLSGCFAVPVTLSLDPSSTESYTYFAVVDTGSPFLTAPTQAYSWTVNVKQKQRSLIKDTSTEQFGATVGTLEWRKAPLVTMVGNDMVLDQRDAILAIPSENVQEETGGIFLGLIENDEYRPTLMRQLGFTSFLMDFQSLQLKMSPNSIQQDMELFDFSGYGPDLHHYGVVCKELTCQYSMNGSNESLATTTFQADQLSRPLVAVFDTGLSGCIFSDTLLQDIQQQMTGPNKFSQPVGCTVLLPARKRKPQETQDHNHKQAMVELH
ncbi:MAG: hypothetical protein SGARI_004220, partial [Bacillariaceae sp.]